MSSNRRNNTLLVISILIFLVFFSNFLDFFENDNQITSDLIDYHGLECSEMFAGDQVSLARGSLFQFDDSIILERLAESKDKCSEFQRIFRFFENPSSLEERDFPLAYGMLVHDNFVQISLLLSAIYQPQNQFCFAIDGSSTQEFIDLIALLASCYSNVHYFITDEIRWCGYEILTSVFKCVEYLAELGADWKYYQYLSGVDAPLKSNLEMVRIFKALNGSFNAEINPFEYYRLNMKRPWKSPLPLFKTSLSATFSRESANFMINNEVVRKQIEFLRGTECADESLWATIAGNPKKLAMPGGFNARDWLYRNLYSPSMMPRHQPSIGTYNVTSHYVSRYQQYVNRPPAKCQGYYYRFSCVFGVYDLPNLVRRHELIAHKLYVSYQPAAFLCLVENSRRKTIMHLDRDFSAEEYRRLPNSPVFVGFE